MALLVRIYNESNGDVFLVGDPSDLRSSGACPDDGDVRMWQI